MHGIKTALCYEDVSRYRTQIMGFAALCIMIHHMGLYCQLQVFPWNQIPSLLNIGVELFLFVSGVGLYYAYSKSDVRFHQYYGKRVLNVYVPYLIIFLPFALLDAFLAGSSVSGFFLSWTGISYWYTATHLNWYVYWTMLLYLLYPLLFRFLSKHDGIKNTFFLCSVLLTNLALCVGLSVWAPLFFESKEIGVSRIAVFVLGCWFGKKVYEKQPIRRSAYVSAAVFAAVGITIRTNNFHFLVNRIGFLQTLSHALRIDTMQYPVYLIRFGSCMVVPLLVFLLAAFFKRCSFRPVTAAFGFLGKTSLETYLLHTLLASTLIKVVHQDCLTLQWYLCVIAVTLLLCYPLSMLRQKLAGMLGNKTQ